MLTEKVTTKKEKQDSVWNTYDKLGNATECKFYKDGVEVAKSMDK